MNSDDDKKLWPKQPLVTLEKAFKDDRGAIQPLVEHMMRSALIIDSRKGAIRGNHYHKSDWHYCYVVSGTMEYYHRPANSIEKPEMILLQKGQMVFSPPMIEHAFKFPEDAIFLTLSRNARDQNAYEEDLIRVAMVS